MSVTLSGIISLTVPIAADGTFSCSVLLGGVTGWVEASFTDREGLGSNIPTIQIV
jgi:hypothetical protein